MGFKNLLLAFSGEAAFKASLAHAIKLAQYHDAWLTAIMRNGASVFDRLGAGLPEHLRAQLSEVENADTKDTIAQFDAAVAEAGLSARAEFIHPDRLGPTLPSAFARHYDLIITGFQSDLPAEEHHVVSPDMIALKSGRPILVVPDTYKASTLSDHALVAWDGERSAARALGDAMQILEGKRRVTVLTVGAARPETLIVGSLLQHLDRHGIDAQHVHKPPNTGGIARVIEDTADEVGARLIVMGAYEHSKFSQDVFGGVTHDVLKTARVPVFMSH
ncbi:MAG: universal stress protein [Pseudomonadota bacterium]